ncbi:hypothetical protein L8T69_24325, partial [Enterobacter roggenkampii]|nr:hypothetical protein [Enterobacter roggenkampii]
AGKKSAQIREILISESAWEEMTCLFAPSLNHHSLTATRRYAFHNAATSHAVVSQVIESYDTK